MKVVVVESPAKAKTINKYLGGDYKVIASVGHVRDLPPKDGSVNPEAGFAMKWEVPSRSHKPIGEISGALKGAEKLILATDPDREGEAISWHVREVMEARKALGGIPVERVVFNEITKHAILTAMEKPRAINDELVEAYLARRALDYLVGFSISPVLWRKLPGARSAGRVQSVALKLICEREAEIEAFNPVEYWSVDAEMQKTDGSGFTARLTHLDGKKLKKYDLNDEAAAGRACDAVRASDFVIDKVETKRQKRNPNPPFTTSTLQQEASRKLGFSAKRTMQVAQKLYEGINIGRETTGLITYMRTDGVTLSGEAVRDIRAQIAAKHGDRYLPDSPRVYKTRAANAQEAHEAIRPTAMAHPPEDVARYLTDDQRRLYELIWRRTLASQMQSAEIDRTSADIVDRDNKATLRATGSVIVFDGFLSLYREGRDDEKPGGNDDDTGDDADNGKTPATEEEDRRFLPPLASGDPLALQAVKPEQHFTQPPPRYTDASLVKKMEELGIGRPSTYASIISVLQDRDYVVKDKGRFTPEHRGRIVSAFLESFFARYVEYGFTARLEEDLDRVSDGQLEWKKLLADFWADFKAQIDGMDDLTRADVLKEVDTLLERHFFPAAGDGSIIRKCTKCADGMLGLQLGRYGAFIGCSNYPDCRYTRQLGGGGDDDAAAHDEFTDGEKLLGQDPDSGEDILLRKGPYGLYVQRGGVEVKKPKRIGVPKRVSHNDIDLAIALQLLTLPREIGAHPETGEMIFAGIGRYGPFLRYGGGYVSLPPDDTLLTIGINHAVEMIETAGIKPPRSLGIPDSIPVVTDKSGREIITGADEITEIHVKTGRFGPYVQMGDINASIPKSMDAEAITLEEAAELIAKKKANPSRWGKKKKAAKTATAKKKTAKKKTAKKKSTGKPKAAADG